METFLSFLISWVFCGIAFMIVAAIVPNFHIRGGLGSAMVIALVYGLLKSVFQVALIVVTFPLVILTMGLFIVAINAFLLWVTDKMLRRFEVSTAGALVLGTVLLSLLDFGFHALFRAGAIL
jgi:putative membrane protein